MVESIKIYLEDLYGVLNEYYPKISYTKMGEIYKDIRDLGKNEKFTLTEIRTDDLSRILQGYYPRISHKMAGRIIQSLIIKSEEK